MSDEDPQGPPTQFHYHLELTPAQLKLTFTALHSLRDDLGHEQSDVLRVIHEVLEKLPTSMPSARSSSTTSSSASSARSEATPAPAVADRRRRARRSRRREWSRRSCRRRSAPARDGCE